MTFEVAFKRLKEKLNNVDAAVLEDMAIQITLSDEDCGGTFYAAVKDHVLSVEPFDYKDNDAVIDVTRTALSNILSKKLSIDTAIEKGDMSVKGNLEKVAAIRAAIKTPAKKATAKKTTAKKTETVKNAKTAAKTKAEPKKAEPKKTEKKSK